MNIRGQKRKRHPYFHTVLVFAVIFATALTAAELSGDQTAEHKFEIRLASYQKVEGWKRVPGPGPQNTPVWISPEVALTNVDIARAWPDRCRENKPCVGVLLTEDGALKLARLTKSHIGELLAIMLDGRVTMAPMINAEISGGRAIMEGNFTEEKVGSIAKVLSGGQAGKTKFEIRLASHEEVEGWERVRGPEPQNTPVWISPEIALTNVDIARAWLDRISEGKPCVGVLLTEDGALKLAHLTKLHIGEFLAVILDGRVNMAPKIWAEISGGRSTISGNNITEEEAKSIAKGLSGDQTGKIPANPVIRRMLVERIGDHNQSAGIVVGAIEPAGRRIVAYGSLSKGDKWPMDGDTVFEIGSITKVFTSLLLADMAQSGDVALSDPAAKYLPKGIKMPERGGRVITLEDLSRQRSGLPRVPTNFGAESDPKNAYADSSVEQLYQFLSTYSLPRDIGAEFEYSNLGAGLLGHLLALASGKDYETLIKTRIARPLHMNSTGIRLSPGMQSRLATGHDNRYEPTLNWYTPTLAGAGALRSTADDMLSFLAAQLEYTKSSLPPAITATRAHWVPAGTGVEIGLGWMKRSGKKREVIWHSGGTDGYSSFVGFDPVARIGVVVLTNARTLAGVDDLGFNLLDPESPLLPVDSPLIRPPLARTEIKLDADILDNYVGRYQLAPNVFITITRKGDQLSAQYTGQEPAEIYAESKTDFFYKVVDAQILFRLDSQGRANALILHQFGRDRLAQRVGGIAEPVTEWFGHKESPVDRAVFDNYIGRYQIGPGAVFTVTRNGDHLYVQLTGRPPLEVFAEGDGKFFSKVYDVQITFETAGQGAASALILHQGDQDLRAGRVTP